MDDNFKMSGPAALDPTLLALGRAEKLTQGSEKGVSDPKTEIEQRKAAEQFEGMLLEQMFKSMWSTLPADNQLLGSKEEEYFRDMFNQALAESVSQGQGIGIKEVILREMRNKDK